MSDVIRELVIRVGYEVDSADLDKAAEALDKMRAESEGAAAQGKETVVVVDQMGKSAERSGVATVALGNILASAAKKVAHLGIQAAKTAVALGVDLVRGFIDAGDRLSDVSQQLGITTTDLQRLEFGAKKTGASSESLHKAIRTMTIGLVEARDKGSGPMAEALAMLGLSVDQLDGKGAEEQMRILADGLAGVASQGDKAAIVAKLFGARSGTELKQLLDQGGEGIRGLGDELAALGGIMGSDSIAAAAALDDQLDNLSAAFDGMKARIGEQLAPILEKLIGQFIAFVEQNDDFIKQELPRLLHEAADAAMVILPAMVDLVKEITNLNDQIRDVDEQMAEDWGPAWSTAKTYIDVFTTSLFQAVEAIEKILELANKLPAAFGIVGVGARVLKGEPTALDDVQVSKERGGGRLDTGFQRRADANKAAADAATARASSASSAAIALNAKIAAGALDSKQRGNAVKQVDSLAAGKRLGAKAKAELSAIKRGVQDGTVTVSAAINAAHQITDDAPKRGAGGGGGGGGRSREAGEAAQVEKEAGVGDMFGDKSGGGGRLGAGSSPSLGATFQNVHQTFNATTSVTVNLPKGSLEGLTSAGQIEKLGERVGEILDARWRRAFAHFGEAVRA